MATNDFRIVASILRMTSCAKTVFDKVVRLPSMIEPSFQYPAGVNQGFDGKIRDAERRIESVIVKDKILPIQDG